MLSPALILTLVLVTAGLTTGPVKGQTSSEKDKRRSGFEFMGASTQAMQKDDSLNPGMLWVKDGEALWLQPQGLSGKACINCHTQAASSMRGVAAAYPAFDALLNRPITISQRINQCRQHH